MGKKKGCAGERPASKRKISESRECGRRKNGALYFRLTTKGESWGGNHICHRECAGRGGNLRRQKSTAGVGLGRGERRENRILHRRRRLGTKEIVLFGEEKGWSDGRQMGTFEEEKSAQSLLAFYPEAKETQLEGGGRGMGKILEGGGKEECFVTLTDRFEKDKVLYLKKEKKIRGNRGERAKLSGCKSGGGALNTGRFKKF